MDGHALLERLAAEPRLAALFFDLDGVLAPIVPRPEDATVPAETRSELERLAGRYALVAVVTGRDGDDARARTGVDGLVYVGSHGLELEPEAEAWAERLQAFAATVDWPLERKRLTVAFHYRSAEDEQEARRTLEAVAERAREEGFVARFGRKVLEVLPPLRGRQGHGRDAPARRADGSPGPSTRATTRPTSTASGRSRGSSSRCASPSPRPRARPSCARRPTSSSRARPAFLEVLREL